MSLYDRSWDSGSGGGLSLCSALPGSRPTHKALLEAGVLIIEGLDLSRVEPGVYTLLCLPLKIMGSDSTPVRVLLMD